MARRQVANHRRAGERRLRLVRRVEAQPRLGQDDAGPLDAELETAMVRLAAAERELVRLWAWEQLEPAEIAVVLGMTANAVSIRLHRVKKKLGELLEEARKDGHLPTHTSRKKNGGPAAMTDDDLRNRLAAANPAPPSEPVDPAGSDRARALMEEIMSTETVQPKPTRRSYRLVGAVAAVLVAAVGAAAIFTGGRDELLVLRADGGDATTICEAYNLATLAQQTVAFGGTVTDLTDTTATFEVDRWFAGGDDADTVEVNYTPGFEALIGTPALEVGQRYLITAADGAVTGCGYSGPATPRLEADFEAIFGA